MGRLLEASTIPRVRETDCDRPETLEKERSLVGILFHCPICNDAKKRVVTGYI